MKYSIEQAANFYPDWRKIYTINELKFDLNVEFKGPGWYITKTDSMLIIPVDHNYKANPIYDMYWVYVWNHLEALNAFKWIASAPIVEDSKNEW